MSKHQLFYELITIGGSHNIDGINEMKDKLSSHLETNGSDAQVEDGLRMLEALSTGNKVSDFDACSEIVAPIFERLSGIYEWDLYDIKLISATLGGAKTADQAYTFAEKALSELEKYSDDKLYKNLRLVVYMNTHYRMLRAKYFDSNNLIPSKTLEDRFYGYDDAIRSICYRENFPIHKAVAYIRMGLFGGYSSYVADGLAELKRVGTPAAEKIHKMMKRDIEQFSFFDKLKMSKDQFDKAIGKLVRDRREATGLSTEELARLVNIPSTTIEGIENGTDTATSFDVTKLVDTLRTEIDYYMIHEKLESEEKDVED